ncbi:MAG: hypothetical protein ABW252_02175 [Polyangiales bacterium]
MGEILEMVSKRAQSRHVDGELDPSSRLIIAEAERRGIAVDVLAPRAEYFRLRHGEKAVTCRESLSDRTSAVALSRCDDKRTTARILRDAGLRVPVQREAGKASENEAFLREHGALVVKPADGEQGKGVCVGIRAPAALALAIDQAAQVSARVLLEECVAGDDVRLIVIDGEVVVAGMRRPPRIRGDGSRSVRALIAALSEQRARETFGESHIPVDDETARCVREAGFALDDVLPRDAEIAVRKGANLHTGGTIEDVTAHIHPALVEVAKRAAAALEIPVVGLDLMVPRVDGTDYWIIEANERPGFAHHEPQPVAERFVDFLFPETRQ